MLILFDVSANNLLKSLEIENSLFCVLEYMLIILSSFFFVLFFKCNSTGITYRRSNRFFFSIEHEMSRQRAGILINIFPYSVYCVWSYVTRSWDVLESMHWMGKRTRAEWYRRATFPCIKILFDNFYATHLTLTLNQQLRPLFTQHTWHWPITSSWGHCLYTIIKSHM